ncbi:hypothetical protein PLESTB_001810800 [Pleodorina starrii]|uniref:Uncharacterized protein n=1 Tax=Pleodorina starrii TaxID=330485 RepID=A0A9W6C1Q6_9CHLO|nr:hypothetical protein PLESTM_000907100 [Pleodorina starrii]GLC61855.1 hypothetical protein PLESTB_001810800 [Pleodorina starrii]GLC76915.1 hypothetical protein PLESTF_001855100 [Pleodorina starrii]
MGIPDGGGGGGGSGGSVLVVCRRRVGAPRAQLVESAACAVIDGVSAAASPPPPPAASPSPGGGRRAGPHRFSTGGRKGKGGSEADAAAGDAMRGAMRSYSDPTEYCGASETLAGGVRPAVRPGLRCDVSPPPLLPPPPRSSSRSRQDGSRPGSKPSCLGR